MKKKSVDGTVWGKSKILAKPEPTCGVVIPWAALSASQKQRFRKAFHSEDAVAARRVALKPFREEEYDHELAMLVGLYNFALHHSKDDAGGLEALLSGLMIAKVNLGEWDSLTWLINHCRKIYPKGILRDEKPPEWTMDAMDHRITASLIAKAVMLRVFGRLTGLDLVALTVPVIFADTVSDLPRLRSVKEMLKTSKAEKLATPIVLIKGLPTKSLLDSEILKEWRKLQAESAAEWNRRREGEQLCSETYFSGLRKSIGLAGLPKSAPRAHLREALDGDKEAYREWMRELRSGCR